MTTSTAPELVVGEYVRLGRHGKLSYRVVKVTERRVCLSGITNDGRDLFRVVRIDHPTLIRERDLAA